MTVLFHYCHNSDATPLFVSIYANTTSCSIIVATNMPIAESIDTRENELCVQEQELFAKEKELFAKAQELFVKEKKLFAKEQELFAKEQELLKREHASDTESLFVLNQQHRHIDQTPMEVHINHSRLCQDIRSLYRRHLTLNQIRWLESNRVIQRQYADRLETANRSMMRKISMQVQFDVEHEQNKCRGTFTQSELDDSIRCHENHMEIWDRQEEERYRSEMTTFLHSVCTELSHH